MKLKKKIICVAGPTASGKTDIAVTLAKRFDGEVVSADSMQLYKGIHIASAAPDDAEKQGIPHHLIEFLELRDSFSVADYLKETHRIIDDINSRGKIPIVAGGTGLYIRSLIQNISFKEFQTDLELRKRLEDEMETVGAEKMLERLKGIDPTAAQKLHPNNRRRIIRAFEIFHSSGVTFTEHNELSRQNDTPYDTLLIGLNFKNRDILYNRINLRVEKMVEKGLIEEAKGTLCLNSGKGAAQAIGHKELYPFLRGECSREEAIEHLKMQTRRYAKRQITWFSKDENIRWIYMDENENPAETAAKLAEEFLKEG